MMEELHGRRVLIVEDEFFLAVDLEDALTIAGAEVIGPLPDLSAALLEAVQGNVDLAILDISLRDELVYPVADALAERNIPFLFASAYQERDLPLRHRARPFLEKPYETSALVVELARLAGRTGPFAAGG